MAGEQEGREELARMAYEAQLLQGQGRALEQQVGALSEGTAQLGIAIESLRSLKVAEGSALIPLGAGAMVRAKLAGEGKVLVDAGAGVVVEKGLEDAIALLEKRLKETDEARGGIERNMSEIARRLQELDGEARGLMRRLKMVPQEG